LGELDQSQDKSKTRTKTRQVKDQRRDKDKKTETKTEQDKCLPLDRPTTKKRQSKVHDRDTDR
jgi:hypothetical protein